MSSLLAGRRVVVEVEDEKPWRSMSMAWKLLWRSLNQTQASTDGQKSSFQRASKNYLQEHSLLLFLFSFFLLQAAFEFLTAKILVKFKESRSIHGPTTAEATNICGAAVDGFAFASIRARRQDGAWRVGTGQGQG